MRIDFTLRKSFYERKESPHYISIHYHDAISLEELEVLEKELIDIIFKIKNYKEEHKNG